METTSNATKKALLLLFKDFTTTPTVTSLAKELKLSRVGTWKALKKLETESYITLKSVGAGKTSASMVKLNWNNLIVEKITALYLTEEALRQPRWRVNFAELENAVDFAILYGSILHSPQEANDIDILTVANKKKFVKIQNIVDRIQKTQTKKIHVLNFTEAEFIVELKKPNKIFIGAIRKGVVLFGQDNFIQFMKGMAQ